MTKTRRPDKAAPAPARTPGKAASPARTQPARPASAQPGKRAAASAAAPASRRKAYVFASLVGTMTATTALLWAMRPAPLLPDAAMSVRAAEGPLDVVFDTRRTGYGDRRWKYLYVHHSRTLAGNAAALADNAATGSAADGLADHFVIGNGDGCADGQVQIGQRWNHQQSAVAVPGVDRMSSDCVSICLIGDYDRTFPTPTQMKRLAELVTTLQGRLRIDRDRVWMTDQPGTPAGIGRYFPRAVFREQILP